MKALTRQRQSAAAALRFAALAVCLLGGWNIAGLIPAMPYWCGAILALSFAALTVLLVVGCVYYAAFLRQLVRSFGRFQHNALASASGEAALPALAINPQFSAKASRRLRAAALISLALFAACFALSYVVCALSAAVTGYQTVFQNPMAAPDILGASSGACFGAALAILTGQSSVMVTVFTFLSSLLTVVLVYLIGSHTRGNRVVSILLAGIMVGSLFSAGTSYIKLVADPGTQLPQITYWLMGSLSGTRMKTVGFAAVCMAVGLLPLLLLRWRMNLLTLSADEARSIGVNTDRLRLAVILSATVLTAASVSVSGMIGWVGLVIPHLSRRLVGNDCRYLLPMSMVFGAAFLLLVDNLARCLTAVEIPIGILTAFVGAPFFVYLMIKGDDRL